jgi:hypothetical protein
MVGEDNVVVIDDDDIGCSEGNGANGLAELANRNEGGRTKGRDNIDMLGGKGRAGRSSLASWVDTIKEPFRL